MGNVITLAFSLAIILEEIDNAPDLVEGTLDFTTK
jgi:hypothetical protein